MNDLTDTIYQIKNEAFQFIGKEYSSDVGAKLDFGQIWGNFFKTGGYDKINVYEKNKDENCVDAIVFYKESLEYKTVYIGKIVADVSIEA